MDGGRDATKWTNVIGLFQLAGPSHPITHKSVLAYPVDTPSHYR